MPGACDSEQLHLWHLYSSEPFDKTIKVFIKVVTTAITKLSWGQRAVAYTRILADSDSKWQAMRVTFTADRKHTYLKKLLKASLSEINDDRTLYSTTKPYRTCKLCAKTQEVDFQGTWCELLKQLSKEQEVEN